MAVYGLPPWLVVWLHVAHRKYRRRSVFAAVASEQSEETAPRMWQPAICAHHRQSSPPQYIARSL